MKILIKPNQFHFEQSDAVSCLGSFGHQVILLQTPLFLECSRGNCELLVISDKDLNEEIQSARTKFNFNLLTVNERTFTLYHKNGKKTINVPRFANTFKYGNSVSDYYLESDIYIHCCFQESIELIQYISHSTNKKIKVSCHSPIHSPSFIGAPSIEQIVKLAKSSKITLSDNNVLIDSLLFCGIPSVSISDYFALQKDFNPDNLLDEQNDIEPLSNFLGTLNEIISNIS